MQNCITIAEIPVSGFNYEVLFRFGSVSGEK